MKIEKLLKNLQILFHIELKASYSNSFLINVIQNELEFVLQFFFPYALNTNNNIKNYLYKTKQTSNTR